MNHIDTFADKATDKVFRYPKFTFLLLTIVASYLFYDSPVSAHIATFFDSLGYFGFAILGIFFAYGFTAAPATAIFMHLAPDYNIFLAAALGGVGAYAGDLMIFLFIRHSFKDEVRRLQQEQIVKSFRMKIPSKARQVLLAAFAGFVIASPLPDELGVAMLASSSRISKRLFAAISYSFNTVGIFVSLYVGTLL
ncbi:MAG TPA: hypothetical protein VK158_00295 [Acidobacteriota bacterium]|nr:hypothetical protein [Acidobacteriota bacterium]